MARIVITGATGVVGTALAKYARDKGDEIVAICRPDSKRLSALAKIQAVRIVECDLENAKNVENEIGRADYFFHLGWRGSVDGRQDVLLQNSNVAMTLDMVNFAASLSCTAFVYMGSQAEYGRIDEVITPQSPVNPDTCYGIAKYAAGCFSRELCGQLGIKHIWARLFSVFGENDWGGSFVNYLIEKLSKNEKPHLTKCDQLWNYIYSKDLAHILYSLTLSGRISEIYCIGSKQSRTLREYAEDIKCVVNYQMELGYGDIPYKDNQIMKMIPDVSKLITDIGVFEETPFKEAILEIVNGRN
jgi:nucleoside-diphosphate-sugar epimerase